MFHEAKLAEVDGLTLGLSNFFLANGMRQTQYQVIFFTDAYNKTIFFPHIRIGKIPHLHIWTLQCPLKYTIK